MSKPTRPMLTPEQVLAQLRALHDQIPDFKLVSPVELRKIRRAGYDVDAELAREAAGAVARSRVIQAALNTTSEELQRADDESARWQTVERELRVVLQGVTTANAIRRQRIAETVREVARISRTLAENERYSEIIPHAENIARIRKRKRKRRK